MTAKRGRPRRSEDQTSERRDEIVSAAKALFTEQGFDAVSMRKIASAAGMGTMTLYQYFPSKAEILHHLWGEFFNTVFEQMRARMAAAPTPLLGLREASHAYLDYFLKNPDHFRVVFSYEDRADADNKFFVDHAQIDDRTRDLYLPISRALDMSEEEMTRLSQSINCQIHGILLNLITISELNWASGTDLLDHFLDAVLAPYDR